MNDIDMSQLEQAVDAYSDTMFRCAYAYCGNREDAEDIVQEAFAAYLAKKPSFKDEQHRKAWLLRVVINKAKNLKRSFWHRNRTELDENTAADYSELDDAEVRSVIRQLPPKYRLITELYYHDGYTIAEIAQITGVPRPTVGHRLKRARELLERILEGYI